MAPVLGLLEAKESAAREAVERARVEAARIAATGVDGPVVSPVGQGHVANM